MAARRRFRPRAAAVKVGTRPVARTPARRRSGGSRSGHINLTRTARTAVCAVRAVAKAGRAGWRKGRVWLQRADPVHRRDAAGLAYTAAAVLTVVAVWVRTGGLPCRLVTTVVVGAAGWMAYLLPVVLAVAAWQSIREVIPRRHRLLGYSCLTVGVAGLSHLALTDAGPLAGRPAGWVGALSGGGLAAVVTVWAAIPLLVLTAVFGGLVLAGTSAADAPRRVWAWLGRHRAAVAEATGPDVQPASADTTQPATTVAGQAPAAEAAAGPPAPATTPAPVGPPVQLTLPVVAPAPVTLLNPGIGRKPRVGDQGKTIQGVLDQFGIAATVADRWVGPTVTLYAVELRNGVRVGQVTGLGKDIGLAVGNRHIRMIDTIEGRSAVGIEVPNPDRSNVALSEILRSPAASAERHPLLVGMGATVDGKPMVRVLAKMPHLLVAGATGQGKSNFIHAALVSILTRATPDEVRMVLVDPKRVELSAYAGLPHLATPIVTRPKDAGEAFEWVVREMDCRYDDFAAAVVPHVDDYNRKIDSGLLQATRHPYLLVVVDEMADLMMAAGKAGKRFEESVVRVAQLGRAAGIHLLLATQHPIVKVITGLIKTNVPARLAFTVTANSDSRVILDQPGAENLLGAGDALLLTADNNTPVRLQAALVTPPEVHAVVDYWRRTGMPPGNLTSRPEPAQVSAPTGPATPKLRLVTATTADVDGEAGLLEHAAELVVTSQFGSTSMLQRKLRVGFAKAGRIMDRLEEAGIVGPADGSKARNVLLGAGDSYKELLAASEPTRPSSML